MFWMGRPSRAPQELTDVLLLAAHYLVDIKAFTGMTKSESSSTTPRRTSRCK